MPVNLEHLRTFLSVAKSGSFNKAAEKEYVTAQSLIKKINLLEKELGFPVMVRRATGIELTPAGAQYLDAAKKMLSIHQSAIEKGRRIAAQKRSIRIAEIGPAFAIYKVCLAFGRLYPDIEQKIVPGDGLSRYADVAEGKTDVAECLYSDEIEALGLAYMPLPDRPWECLLAPNHPLAQKKTLTVQDFEGATIVVGNRKRMQGIVDCIAQSVRHITVEELPWTTHNILTACLSGKLFVAAQGAEITDQLIGIPIDCDAPCKVGLVYRNEENVALERFIQVARTV